MNVQFQTYIKDKNIEQLQILFVILNTVILFVYLSNIKSKRLHFYFDFLTLLVCTANQDKKIIDAKIIPTFKHTTISLGKKRFYLLSPMQDFGFRTRIWNTPCYRTT